MAPRKPYLNEIESFLAQKRIAMIGISREKQNIGPSLMDQFIKNGYEILPVNPNAKDIKGKPCYGSVREIQPAPEAALILTSPKVTDGIVRECAEAGVKYIWLYRGGGQGAVTPEAVEYCRAHGISVVPGECPFMFLSPVHGVHWFHKFVYKIAGLYPQHAPTAAR